MAIGRHLVIFFSIVIVASSEKRVHIVHWEKTNPMFRIDNTDNVIDVNVGNTRWEYDQANFVCPMAKRTSSRQEEAEKFIIYNVSKEEYDSCMVTQPSSRIVASCTDPYQRLYFTITFRSFTPTPGGLEFHPGKDYYFITTSHPQNLHGKIGGRCASHNMKVIFKVANSTTKSLNEAKSEAKMPKSSVFDEKNKYFPVLPDTSSEEENVKEKAKKVLKDFHEKFQNEVIKQEASRMHSGDSAVKMLSKNANSATFLVYLLVFGLLMQKFC